MKIAVVSRQKAEYFCMDAHNFITDIISIETPANTYRGRIFESSENGVRRILKLAFFDDIKGDGIMTAEDAEKVRGFVMQDPQPDLLLVHCDGGISRSAGVAAAIMKYLTGSDEEIFVSRMYRPNMHCYRMTLNALMGSPAAQGESAMKNGAFVFQLEEDGAEVQKEDTPE